MLQQPVLTSPAGGTGRWCWRFECWRFSASLTLKNQSDLFSEKIPVNKLLKLILVCAAMLLVVNMPTAAQAQAPGATVVQGGGVSGAFGSGAFGAGLVVIGAAYGISKLGAAGFESMARQPEVKQNIFVLLIIVAALIEGFTFFAVYVCMTQNPWPVVGG